MKQHSDTLAIRTRGPGLIDITDHAARFVEASKIAEGLLTLFIRHTSASLLVQENADPDVLTDLENFMRRTVSRDTALYRHTTEGPDDMPAHIRSADADLAVDSGARRRNGAGYLAGDLRLRAPRPRPRARDRGAHHRGLDQTCIRRQLAQRDFRAGAVM